ncbi:MAG: hypothetical protein WDN29_01665 [Methylovirgula sp.]
MLEAAILLELALGKYVEGRDHRASSNFQRRTRTVPAEPRPDDPPALKSRLALNASVRRDGTWRTMPAVDLMPGDLVKLSLGGVRPCGCEAYRR